jgi:hypothetical protein
MINMVHKIKDMTAFEIRNEMEKITNNAVKNCKWVHENKRFIALLNEYERKVGLNGS